MRDSLRIALPKLVNALGGPSATARLVGRRYRTMKHYLDADRPLPPAVARALADHAGALVSELLIAVHDLRKEAEASEQRRARIRLAARERYYHRFGCYPQPARGDKPR
jgi:NADPH-dependent ferric siderophore reductase